MNRIGVASPHVLKGLSFRSLCWIVWATTFVLPSAGALAQSRWHVSYRRSCESVAFPVLTWDGASVLACGQTFDARTGAFLGRAPMGALAAFPDGSVLVQDYTDRGVSLVRRNATTPVAHDSGGMVRRIAVSPSGRFVATIEDSCPGTRLIVRRVEGPSALLRRVREERLSVANPERAALVIDDQGTASSWVESNGPFVHVAISSDESTRAFVHRDGRVTMSTNGAAEIEIARADPSGTVELTLDPTGRRLAIRDRAGLRIVESNGRRTITLLDEAIGGSPVVFGSGDRVFLGGTALVGISTTGRRSWTRPRYAPRLPEGWEAGVVGAGVLRFPSHAGSEWAADPEQVAAFAESEGGAMVTAIATDAAELSAARTLAAWAIAVVSRYEPYSPLEGSSDRSRQPYRVYRDASGRRTVDMTIPADGCDPSFRWVRFVEMGDALLRVVVRIPISMDREDQDRVRQVFLDAPFGPVVSDSAASSPRVREPSRGRR